MAHAPFADLAEQMQGPPEEAVDAWHVHTALAGDPYPEGEVTRGVCLAHDVPDAPLPFGAGAWAGCGYGHEGLFTDLHCDLDPYADAPLGPGSMAPLKRAGNSLKGDGPVGFGESLPGRAGSEPRPEGFTILDLPPQLPAEPFRLEPTTIRVCSDEPHSVGNFVLDFFCDRADVSSMKVKHHKYSFKAELLGMSTCKVRVYALDTGAEIAGAAEGAAAPRPALAVEAQRRKGDPVAFQRLYRDLAAHLRGAGLVLDGGAPSEPEAPPPPELGAASADCAVRGADFAPLCDMAAAAASLPTAAHRDGGRALRAEAAFAFSQAAQDVQTAGLLSTAQTLQALEGLMRAGQEEEVLHPAARAMHSLVLQSCSEHLFVSHGAFDIIRNALQETSLSAMARRELTMALDEATSRFGAATSQDLARKTHGILTNAELGAHVWGSSNDVARAGPPGPPSKLGGQRPEVGPWPSMYS